MKIAYLAAGAGNMYCGSCLQSNALVAAMRQLGEDALLLPMYTPIRADEPSVSVRRIAFGGVNVYLQQTSGIFRWTPPLFDSLLDRPGLLRWLGRQAASTRPESLGPLTLSMLQGEGGRQRKELGKLVGWLRRLQPDVVHLANALLIGVARRVAAELGVPVVATLAGEDGFLDRIPPPHHDACRRELSARCEHLDALVAMNEYYADFMALYLRVPRDRITIIPPGLTLDGHAPPGQARSRQAETFKIGYFSRIAPEKGLHLLTEAFRMLCEDEDLPPLELHAAGHLGKADRPYLRQLERELAGCGLADRFCYHGELERQGKIRFLQSLDVMSTPTVQRECKGLAVLEAWANGVACVLPDHGAFPEMAAQTGGALLCRPHDTGSLAHALKQAIVDRSATQSMGQQAQQAVHQRFHARLAARRTIELYRRLLEARGRQIPIAAADHRHDDAARPSRDEGQSGSIRDHE